MPSSRWIIRPIFGAVLVLSQCLGTLFLSLARAEEPPLPDDRLGIRTAPLLLLSRPDVRADMELEPAQALAAERAIADLYVRAAGLRGKRGPEAVEARKAIDDAQREWIVTNLTPSQQDRLVQIDLQWEGPSALNSRPIVTDALALTAGQRDVIRQAVATRDKARAEGAYTASDERTLFEAAHKVLSAAQLERWRAMLGREFVPKLASSRP